MKKFLFSLVIGGAFSAQAAVVFNEIMYRPPNLAAAYVELFNTSSNASVPLAGWQVAGLEYTFPAGASIGPQGFLVLAKDRTTFTNTYGASAPVFDQFAGDLSTTGETLTLLLPGGATNDPASVVDQVRYENSVPWSTNANGTGSSLQLIDPNQDNTRVADWATRYVAAIPTGGLVAQDGWRFFSASGSIGAGDVSGSTAMRLLVYLGETGSALIDDLSIVAGTNAAVGFNFVRNGNFETPFDTGFSNSWFFGTNYTNTLIVNDLVHSGNGSMKIIGESPGAALPPTFSKSIQQFLDPAPAPNSTNTLSFWYWATNSATNLFLRIRNSPALTVGGNGTNIQIFYVVNTGPPIPATNYFSPGSNNITRATLPAFPSLWINRVQAENVTGLIDGYGEHDPWIEIYNSGNTAVSLDGLYLSGTYTNLTNWAFPLGRLIGATQSLVVFCDGDGGQTTASEFHTSFRLPAATGSIALSRFVNGVPQIIDYINYAGLPADHTYRSVPDGQPFFRQDYFRPPAIISQVAGSSVLNPAAGLGTVTLNAVVNPNGLSANAFIQHGVTTSYGISTVPVPVAAGITNVSVNLPLTLGPGLTWHYRMVAANAAGSTNGPDHTVTISRLGDLNGDGTVSRSELDSVYAGYAMASPWLLMTNVAGAGGTNVTFALPNSVEGAYGVEYSTNLNLNTWQPLGPALPRYLFIDTNAPGQPQRYYRLRWP